MPETWGLETRGIVYKYKYIHNMSVGDKETGDSGDTYKHTYMHACIYIYKTVVCLCVWRCMQGHTKFRVVLHDVLPHTHIRPVLVKNMLILASYANK